MKNSSQVKTVVWNILLIILGTFIMGISYSIFLTPNNLAPGGFAGISAILVSLFLKMGIIVPPSVIYILLNAVLFLVSFKSAGKQFVLYSIIGVLSFSVWLEVCSLIPFEMENELMISAIYGGLLMGAGTGTVIRMGGSTGGSDMLGCLIRSKTNKFTTGELIILINVVVLTLSIFVYGLFNALYSFIAIIISGFVADKVIEGSRAVKAYYIITSKQDEIAKEIFEKLHRGATSLEANGMYTHEHKSVLLCLLNVRQSPILRKIVLQVDESAFMFSTSVNEAIGKGFYIAKKESIEKRKTHHKQNQNQNKINDNKVNKTINDTNKINETIVVENQIIDK